MKKTILILLSTLILSAFTAKSQNTWEQITPTGDIPGSRQGHSMVTIDDKIYLFGGMDGSKLYEIEPEIYIAVSDNTRVVKTLKTKKPTLKGSKSLLNNLSIYDTVYQKWDEEEPANTPPPTRFGHKAVVKDGKMYVFFGMGDSNALDDIWEYDPATKEWTQIVPVSSNNPVARFDHSATISGSVVWIAGGLDNNGNPLNDLWYYSFGSNEFTQCNNIPAASGIYGHVAACSGSELYVYGGYQGSEPANTMYKYTIGSGGTWTTENIQGILPAPTAYSAAAQYGPELYIAGGETSTGVTGSAYVWDMLQQQFTQLSDGPAWAYGAFAFLYSPNITKQNKETEYAKILFYGGSSDFVNYNEETWVYTTDIEISTNINETENNKIKIYPNPATSQISFTIPSTESIVSIKIYNQNGQIIQQIIKPDQTTINISGLIPGLYFIRIDTEANRYISKIIKE